MSRKKDDKQEKKETKQTEAPLTEEENLKKQLDDYKETLQRLQAEFENYRKRIEKEKEQFVKCANAELIKKLLCVLDEFELALKNKDKPADFVKGVELIYANFFSILEHYGLRPINSLNQKFDPYRHEVLLQEITDKEEGTVLEELQKGYMLNDMIIRHSKVKISKCKKDGE